MGMLEHCVHIWTVMAKHKARVLVPGVSHLPPLVREKAEDIKENISA